MHRLRAKFVMDGAQNLLPSDHVDLAGGSSDTEIDAGVVPPWQVMQPDVEDGELTIVDEDLCLHIAAYSTVGQQRTINEDSLGVALRRVSQSRVRILLVVADGLGGHANGKAASAQAVQTMQDMLADKPDHLHPAMLDLITTANSALVVNNNRSDYDNTGRPPATTIVSLLVQGYQAVVGNIGDSRAYLLRHSRIRQLTQDDAGAMGTVTQCLGIGLSIEPHLTTVKLLPDDIVLLCSDGLTRELSDSEIQRILWTHLRRDGLGSAMQALGEAANWRGGHDNITVLALACVARRPQTSSDTPHRQLWARFRQLFQATLLLLMTCKAATSD